MCRQPSGIPCPINRAFRPVCSSASLMVFTDVEPRILTTWLLKSASTFFIPKINSPEYQRTYHNLSLNKAKKKRINKYIKNNLPEQLNKAQITYHEQFVIYSWQLWHNPHNSYPPCTRSDTKPIPKFKISNIIQQNHLISITHMRFHII